MQNLTEMSTSPTDHARRRLDPDFVLRALGKRSFATLATASPGGRPHDAGVLYSLADGALWISTHRTSRKARNIERNPLVAVAVPIRRIPVGPPSCVHFQTRAEVLACDDPELVALADAGGLKTITSHGELDLPDGCFLRLPLPNRLVTYGLGMSLWRLARDPLAAGGVVELR